MKLIEIENICKQFESGGVITKVLFDVSFVIQEGEFVAIMGKSGSGKSTLMNILSFLDKPTCGAYLFKEKNTSKFTDKELALLRNEEIGFVFQQFNLLPKTSVLENVKLPLVYSKKLKSPAEKTKAAQEAIKAVGLEHRKNNLSNQLSGGEKQRVAIARALVNQPSIIFADEPTGNLDSKSGEIVMKILNNLNQQGKTIILVTHEQYTAEYSQRIIYLQDGHISRDTAVENRRNAGLVK